MVEIRRAGQRDCDVIAKLAAEAGAEEGVPSALEADRIRAHAFGPNSLFEAWIAEERPGKNPVAHAIITKSYDVRRAIPTIILSQLYVRPEQRRDGVARLLMSAIARHAVDLRRCRRRGWAHGARSVDIAPRARERLAVPRRPPDSARRA